MRRAVLFTLGLTVTAVYLFPLYWMYVTAFKGASEIFRSPPTFWPAAPEWNVERVLAAAPLGAYVGNSLLIAGLTTALVVLLGTGCACVLARRRDRRVEAALIAIVVAQALPPALMVSSLYVVFGKIGLLDMPRLAVALALAARLLPLYIILCRTSFMQVPRGPEEAALVDGASRIGVFFRISLPLASGGVLVSALLVFVQALGDYVFARSLIVAEGYQTATVGLQNFMGPNTNDWTAAMTYAALYVTPTLVVFVLLQRRIIGGLTGGAVH